MYVRMYYFPSRRSRGTSTRPVYACALFGKDRSSGKESLTHCSAKRAPVDSVVCRRDFLWIKVKVLSASAPAELPLLPQGCADGAFCPTRRDAGRGDRSASQSGGFSGS